MAEGDALVVTGEVSYVGFRKADIEGVTDVEVNVVGTSEVPSVIVCRALGNVLVIASLEIE